MKIIRYRKIWFALSGLLIAASLAAIFAYGFNLGIDFRGGSLTEVRYVGERPDKSLLEEKIGNLGLGGFSVRPSGESNYIIRTRELSESERRELNESFALSGAEYSIERANTIGPTAGAELQKKASLAVGVVILLILAFVTFAFRRVSKPVASWKYGLATIIALFHDVIIPVGIFVLLGRFLGVEMDLLFVSGLLAILGFSVHDTIVVFDRVRENLRVNLESKRGEEFGATVGRSLMETMTRSVNTSLTLFFVLMALYFFGSPATKDFTLLMLVGTLVGAYSSIFIAAPLLVTFHRTQNRSK